MFDTMKIKNLFLAALIVMLAATTSCATTQQKNKDNKSEDTELYDEFDLDEDGEEFGVEASEDDLMEAESAGEIVLNGDPNDAHHIVISKESMTLNLYDSKNGLIYSFPVAVGKNLGNKKEIGDMKTSEGEFEVQSIQDASSWGHDFNDGKGYIKNAYGNWFIRLKTYPHTGIGIHGTHDPNSIGTRATEGCIRLNNADLDKLQPLVKMGMKVTIEPSVADQEADGKIDASGVNQETIAEIEDEDFFEDVKKNEQKALGEIPADVTVVKHTIVEGDTFNKIAKDYGTTSEKIQELNPDVDPRRLKLGSEIIVKGNVSASATPAKQEAKKEEAKPAVQANDGDAVYHTIVSGDYYGKLAEQYGTSSSKIQELNPDVDPTKLQIGQKIRVK